MTDKLLNAAHWIWDRARDIYALAIESIARHPAPAFWLIVGLVIAAVL
jgi:hypothetical protein